MKTQQQIESDFLGRVAYNTDDFQKVKRFTLRVQRVQMWRIVK